MHFFLKLQAVLIHVVPQKHLMHLKVIQQMSRLQVPRSIGIPPLSDPSFDDALNSQAALLMNSSNSNSLVPMSPGGGSPMGYDDGRINPLAGMGLTDEQYNMILQNIVNGETFTGINMSMDGSGPSTGDKRSLDEEDDDGRDGKRSRFEVIE